jgi:hypothetical protein
MLLLFFLGFIFVLLFQLSRINRPYRVKLDTVCCYTLEDAHIQGDVVDLFVHSLAPYTIDIIRLSHTLETIEHLPGGDAQIQSSLCHPKNGFSWKKTNEIRTEHLTPGYYLIKIINSMDSFMCPLIISPTSIQEITLVSDTNTWKAYNNFARKSNYMDVSNPIPLRWLVGLYKLLQLTNIPNIQGGYFWDRINMILGTHLPDRRPYSKEKVTRHFRNVVSPTEPTTSQSVRTAWCLSAFLEKHQIPFGVVSDKRFTFDYDVNQAKLLIFHVHSEYWSKIAVGKLIEYLEKGGKVFFASGNNLFHEVIYYDHGMRFITQGHHERDIQSLTGTSYTSSGYYTYAPYRITDASHWIYSGAPVANGTLFGEKSAWRSDDYTQQGASGCETDKIGPYSSGFKTLAHGINPDGGGAHLVIKEAHGGWLINASSMSFTSSLQLDPVVDQIVLNIIKKALGHTL